MAETINMPKLGFDMAEGLLVRWMKQVGENINKGDVLAEIETDKATVEVESSASGVVLQLIADQGTMVPVNAPIAMIGAEGEKVDIKTEYKGQKTEAVASESRSVASSSVLRPSSELKASPLAKKLARDQKVDLSKVQGTGPGGRIVRRDIEAALAGTTKDERPKTEVATPSSALRPLSAVDQTIPTTKLRQAIGRRLVESKTTIPHFYVSHEYRMDSLMEIRRQLNAYLPDNEKISVNDFIVKAVALTLRQFPNLNATIKGNEITQFGHVNVGVAVTVPGGLMTVVVKDTDQKTLRQISGEVKTMAARAREGKVKPEDVDGSTFSTSNLGMYDVENFTAIINPPEAAILAISSAREVPVVVGADGHPPVLGIGWRMKATISVDHRISDGAEAAQFMQALAGYLENPVRMLL